MTLIDLLPLVVLGAVLGLDVVSFPQTMVSRPIVAATAAGALVGEPMRGLLAGATLECFALETLPFGASRYPEWASASVVAGALCAMQQEGLTGSLATAVLLGLAVAHVGGWSMVQVRRLNARWARERHEAVALGSKRVVEGLQIRGLTLDLARGAALTGLMLVVAVPLDRWIVRSGTGDPRVSRAVVVTLAATVAGGAVWKTIHATPGARWLFAGGLAIGLLTLAVR